MPDRRPTPARTRAQALVEFAFVVMFGMLAMVMTIDIGRFFYEYNAMRGAVLMGSVQMQNTGAYSGLPNCGTAGAATNSWSRSAWPDPESVWPSASPSNDTRCGRIWRIIAEASGLAEASRNDLLGTALLQAERETINMSAGANLLFTSCTAYTITWSRPFLPVAPFSRQLLGLTGASLVMTAEVESRHNNNPGGVACT